MTDGIEFTEEARLRLARYSSPVTKSGCIEWTGALLKSGYGQLKFRGRNWRAHRLSYLVENGSLTPGMVVNHLCGNIRCINASCHLEEVTQGQNTQYRSVMMGNNTSGHRNVFWDKSRGKWLVSVQIEYKQHHFGRFEDKSEAIAAAIKAREKLGYHRDGGVIE